MNEFPGRKVDMHTEDIEIVTYDKLHTDAIMIRKVVFEDEQGFEEEFDEIDENDIAKHMVFYKGGEPIGTCRYYMQDGEYRIGRIAVIKEYRGKGLGEFIVRVAEDKVFEIGGRESVLSAQVRAKGFYEKIGYAEEGEIYMEEMCPHIKMRKKLTKGK